MWNKNQHATIITVMTGLSKDKPWIGNAIFFGPHNTQPGNNDTTVITSTESSASSGPNDFDSEMNDIQLAQTFESSDEEDDDLNSKPSPEANITKNNLFMNLRSGRYELIHGKRALIQVFTTNCDHCVKAL
jgi:hypothetical protein